MSDRDSCGARQCLAGVLPLQSLTSFSSPGYAVVGIAAVAVLAWMAGRVVPFYRAEIRREATARLTPLDGLRGILCFGVMFCHGAVTHGLLRTGVWAVPASAFYRLLGEASVGFFFCVTGFLFWSRVLATGGRIEPRSFLVARWFRIVPMYAVTVAVMLSVVARRVEWLAPATAVQLGKAAVFGLRPLGPMGGGVDFSQVNAGVTWSLQYEWAFYLSVPAMAVFVAAGRSRHLLFAAAALVVWIGQDRAEFFAPGILAAYAARNADLAATLRRPVASLAVLAVLIAFPLATHDAYGPVGLACTTLAFVPIACGNRLFGLLTLSGLRVMGLVSYSVYLLHGIALYLARPILATWAGPAATAGDDLRYWAVVTALAVAVLVVCLATFRLVEFPCVQLEKRWRRTPRTADLVLADRGPADTAAAVS